MIPAATRDAVRRRAGDRCEYCRLPEVAEPDARFHIVDHPWIWIQSEAAHCAYAAEPARFEPTEYGEAGVSSSTPCRTKCLKSTLLPRSSW